ncbi:DNA-binding transcriptional LysR family regulator [Kineococcus xinjiangensis]|uniref:DNA-binding transcriptional LysR family regulator n=1 Tax=Kineococcus xinjiangensis TaxID=512762 RepID=A0A2S6IVS4_9ACTN|nr:LysR family transcriptional regulator [Kineococcus xinjiangensis]PPK98448.1 DNA-binding transcriptional LysR family regulator [Kineococcus xinjiangensis]
MTLGGGTRDLDPRRLLVLAEVARRGSLTRAAQALGWTQPAVAQHVRHLERATGCALVLRTPRGVSLTPAGRALAAHAEVIADRLRLAADDLATLGAAQARRVRLAAFPSACATLVPAALADLRRRGDPPDVRLTEAAPEEARQLLDAGDVDVAVVFQHGGEAPPGGELLLQDPLHLVLPRGHALAPRAGAPGTPVHLADLAGERWIAGCPGCRAHLLRTAAQAGFEPDVHHSTDDYVVTQKLVAAGVGVALLPGLALCAVRDPGVAVVGLRAAPRRSVHLLPGPAGSSAAVATALRRAAGVSPAPSPTR